MTDVDFSGPAESIFRNEGGQTQSINSSVICKHANRISTHDARVAAANFVGTNCTTADGILGIVMEVGEVGDSESGVAPFEREFLRFLQTNGLFPSTVQPLEAAKSLTLRSGGPASTVNSSKSPSTPQLLCRKKTEHISSAVSWPMRSLNINLTDGCQTRKIKNEDFVANALHSVLIGTFAGNELPHELRNCKRFVALDVDMLRYVRRKC